MSETTVVLDVEGVSCGHCKAAIEKALASLNGVFGVDVDLAGQRVAVKFDSEKITAANLKTGIIALGYKVKRV